MDLLFLIFKGFLIGLAIAAPVGPIGILCIKRTLVGGRLSGLISGLGAATADAFYGAIAAYGLTFVSSFFTNEEEFFRFVGGIFLIYLGIRTFISEPKNDLAKTEKESLLKDYASTLFLTITNPTTIFSFLAVFAGLGIQAHPNFADSTSILLGIFIGSTAWWFMLSSFVSTIRHKFNEASLRTANKISGAAIIVFGVAAIISMLVK